MGCPDSVIEYENLSSACLWVVGGAGWVGSRGEPTLDSVLGNSSGSRMPCSCLFARLTNLSFCL